MAKTDLMPTEIPNSPRVKGGTRRVRQNQEVSGFRQDECAAMVALAEVFHDLFLRHRRLLDEEKSEQNLTLTEGGKLLVQ